MIETRTKYSSQQLDMLQLVECNKLKDSQITNLQNEVKSLRQQLKVEYNSLVEEKKLCAKIHANEMTNNSRLEFDAKKWAKRYVLQFDLFLIPSYPIF